MWLSGDQAIAHVRACTWRTALHPGPTLSMVARTALKIELAAASIHAQGRLRVPTPLPGRVLLRRTGAIPPMFWPGAEWDGRDGFQNDSRSEELPRFQVSDTDLHARWPVTDRIPMPAPFDVDWPPLPQVIAAMTRCLGVSPEAAVDWLIETWEDKKLKASKGHGSFGRFLFKEWEQADPNAVRIAHEFSNQGGDSIVLSADDVIALEPRLVLSSAWPGAGAPGPPVSSLTPPGSSVTPLAQARTRATTLAEKVAAELRQMFPNGRPEILVKELTAQVALRPGVGRPGQRTVEEAIRLAWGEPKNRRVPHRSA